jgi:hypothetical protein
MRFLYLLLAIALLISILTPEETSSIIIKKKIIVKKKIIIIGWVYSKIKKMWDLECLYTHLSSYNDASNHCQWLFSFLPPSFLWNPVFEWLEPHVYLVWLILIFYFLWIPFITDATHD